MGFDKHQLHLAAASRDAGLREQLPKVEEFMEVPKRWVLGLDAQKWRDINGATLPKTNMAP